MILHFTSVWIQLGFQWLPVFTVNHSRRRIHFSDANPCADILAKVLLRVSDLDLIPDWQNSGKIAKIQPNSLITTLFAKSNVVNIQVPGERVAIEHSRAFGGHIFFSAG